jgi:hypothetical protein
MVQKYEVLTEQEIIEHYKEIKNKEREKNKLAYTRLKEKKIQYRKHLLKSLDTENERIARIKSDPIEYEKYKENRKYINAKAYLIRITKNIDDQMKGLLLDHDDEI